MKILLAILLCPVLVASQCFAIDGGPWGGGGGGISVTGTYAGVMFATSHVLLCCDAVGNTVPCTSPDSTGNCPNQPTGTNSLGIFSLVVPNTGLATGPAVLFQQGQIYTGTIRAVADPDNARMRGIFSAQFPYIIILPGPPDSDGNPTTITETVAAQASGTLNVRIKANQEIASISPARLKGTADVQFALTVNNPFDEILFKVSGFKQASQ